MKNKLDQKNILTLLVIVIVIILIATAVSGSKRAEAPTEETSRENSNETTANETPSTKTTVTSPKPTTSATNSTPAQVVTVVYSDSGFTPSITTIKRGQTVKFVNESTTGKFMWIASNPHPTHSTYPAFNQKSSVGPGGSWSFTFPNTGKWAFHNDLEPRRQGSVLVNYD